MEETKVIWKDTTSYGKYDTEKKQNAWTYANGDMRITVLTGHIYYPGNWVMHCHIVGFNTVDMKRTVEDTTPEQAQKLAIKHIKSRLQNLINSLPVEKPIFPSSEETLQGHLKPDAE